MKWTNGEISKWRGSLSLSPPPPLTCVIESPNQWTTLWTQDCQKTKACLFRHHPFTLLPARGFLHIKNKSTHVWHGSKVPSMSFSNINQVIGNLFIMLNWAIPNFWNVNNMSCQQFGNWNSHGSHNFFLIFLFYFCE